MSCGRSVILLCFIVIIPILQLAFASQAAFTVNETVPVPVSLGLTSRDDDALHVQTVFDEVLQEVSDRVNMSFGYVKECVHLLCKTQSTNLTRALNSAFHLMTNNMEYDALQTGSTVRGMCNNYVCTSTLHKNSGGTL